jgi:hypothetical protein
VRWKGRARVREERWDELMPTRRDMQRLLYPCMVVEHTQEVY